MRPSRGQSGQRAARQATLDLLEDASGGLTRYGLARIQRDPPARECMGKEEARMAV